MRLPRYARIDKDRRLSHFTRYGTFVLTIITKSAT
jgi:hypothetical protein